MFIYLECIVCLHRYCTLLTKKVPKVPQGFNFELTFKGKLKIYILKLAL